MPSAGVLPNATARSSRAPALGCRTLPCRAVGTRGLVVGISPALSLHEHVRRYGPPTEGFDVIIYTGSGLMAREIENIRSSDVVILAGGRSGTLGEFAIAYDEGRLWGVAILHGQPGVAEAALYGDILHVLCSEAMAPDLRGPLERDGIGVSEVYEINPTLEDVFISLMQHA